MERGCILARVGSSEIRHSTVSHSHHSVRYGEGVRKKEWRAGRGHRHVHIMALAILLMD